MNDGTLKDSRVSYTLELDGRLYVVENVPARVDEQTGEQFFSPDTVERLRETIRGGTAPSKVIETPVYAYPD
jgi:YgiT-type zinc finger domain-containing protein